MKTAYHVKNKRIDKYHISINIKIMQKNIMFL